MSNNLLIMHGLDTRYIPMEIIFMETRIQEGREILICQVFFYKSVPLGSTKSSFEFIFGERFLYYSKVTIH